MTDKRWCTYANGLCKYCSDNKVLCNFEERSGASYLDCKLLDSVVNHPTKEDILFVLKDVIENEVPFWELDFGYLKEGLTQEQQKEWVNNCIERAINIIKNSL